MDSVSTSHGHPGSSAETGTSRVPHGHGLDLDSGGNHEHQTVQTGDSGRHSHQSFQTADGGGHGHQAYDVRGGAHPHNSSNTGANGNHEHDKGTTKGGGGHMKTALHTSHLLTSFSTSDTKVSRKGDFFLSI